MKKRIRKFTAIVSAVALALTGGNIGGIGMLTARAEAQDAFEVTGTGYSYSDGVLTIQDGAEVTIKNTDPGTSTTDRIVVEKDANASIILSGVNIGTTETEDRFCAFQIEDDSESSDISEASDASEVVGTGEVADTGETTDNSESSDTSEAVDTSEATDTSEVTDTSEATDTSEVAGIGGMVDTSETIDTNEAADTISESDEKANIGIAIFCAAVGIAGAAIFVFAKRRKSK